MSHAAKAGLSRTFPRQYFASLLLVPCSFPIKTKARNRLGTTILVWDAKSKNFFVAID